MDRVPRSNVEKDSKRVKKAEFIQQYEKKFHEVEIYIKRQSLIYENARYQSYIDFEIIPFLNQNENIVRRRTKLYEEINIIKNDHHKIYNENNEILSKNSNYKLNKHKKSQDDYEKQQKYLNLIQTLSSKLKAMEKSNSDFKNKIKQTESKIQFLNDDNYQLNENCEKGLRMIALRSNLNENTDKELFSSNLNEFNKARIKIANKKIDQDIENIDLKEIEEKIRNSVNQNQIRRKTLQDQSIIKKKRGR